jgi:hypothetical protein
VKGRFKKVATQQAGTYMTYEDCCGFLASHPTIMKDLTVNVKEYTDHTRETEHRRKVAALLLGRARSDSADAISLDISGIELPKTKCGIFRDVDDIAGSRDGPAARGT